MTKCIGKAFMTALKTMEPDAITRETKCLETILQDIYAVLFVTVFSKNVCECLPFKSDCFGRQS